MLARPRRDSPPTPNAKSIGNQGNSSKPLFFVREPHQTCKKLGKVECENKHNKLKTVICRPQLCLDRIKYVYRYALFQDQSYYICVCMNFEFELPNLNFGYDKQIVIDKKYYILRLELVVKFTQVARGI